MAVTETGSCASEADPQVPSEPVKVHPGVARARVSVPRFEANKLLQWLGAVFAMLRIYVAMLRIYDACTYACP